MVNESFIFYILYFALSLCGFFCYYDVITQPDTFNYLIISEDFLHGRVYEGINSMWGSLITILIVPLLALGFGGLTAFKIIQIIAGFFTLHIFLKMLARIRLPFLWRAFAVISVLPMLLLGTLILTPDLLLLTATIWYIFLITEKSFFEKKQAWKIGLAGGLMYWSKSYGFPFFVAHFTVLNVLLIFYFLLFKCFNTSENTFTKLSKFSKRQHKAGLPLGKKGALSILQNYLISMLVFALISGVWIAAISYKTGHLTIGTAGKYNIALKGNVMNDTHLTKNELRNPNTPYTKYWIYHEAGLFVDAWNPFATSENIRHFTHNIRKNLSSLYYVTFIRDMLILIVLASLIWFFISREARRTLKVNQAQVYFILVSILACVIYTGGYLLVFIQQRYLWLIFILLWLIFLIIIKNIFKLFIIKKEKNNKEKSENQRVNLFQNPCTYWLLAASIIMSVNHLDRLREMTKDRDFFAHLNEVSAKLKQLSMTGKRVAANNVKGNMISVDADIYLLYHHRFDYWGQLANDRLEREGLQTVYDHRINYFFCWDSPDFEQELFEAHQLVFRDDIIDLSIYTMTDFPR